MRSSNDTNVIIQTQAAVHLPVMNVTQSTHGCKVTFKKLNGKCFIGTI